VDSYVVAGVSDHITPWESCYRSAALLGGTTRFVLSTSGHIAALVNPPGNPKASFHAGGDVTVDSKAWLKDSEVHLGSWWTDLGPWLDERGGARRPAPTRLGSSRLRVLAEAPGTYVFDE
jgi:polyhydroxyalkanoate synthase